MNERIYLSPSNQVSNKYAYGNVSEAEVCCKIADATEAALRRNYFEVINNQTSAVTARCSESDKWKADLYVPIHTNAYNGEVSGTRMFCYNTKGEGYKACQAIFAHLAPLTPGTSENIQAKNTLLEVRLPSAPTAYVEVDFHDVAEVAKWLIENTEAIGEAIAHGICDYFGVAFIPPVVEKKSLVLGEYETLREADDALSDLLNDAAKAEQMLKELNETLNRVRGVLDGIRVEG